ncbi:hypothetical protein K440DRAFT_5587 [Wilcoxina mikolae CBS 423.85]|nr:hypothetical protein K440DRAFT_5587 [Wilcoxina mikolae CBS 423.85]
MARAPRPPRPLYVTLSPPLAPPPLLHSGSFRRVLLLLLLQRSILLPQSSDCLFQPMLLPPNSLTGCWASHSSDRFILSICNSTRFFWAVAKFASASLASYSVRTNRLIDCAISLTELLIAPVSAIIVRMLSSCIFFTGLRFAPAVVPYPTAAVQTPAARLRLVLLQL